MMKDVVPQFSVELGLYQDCLYDIRQRIDVIADHISQRTSEKYLIIEVETVCLQFRKILEQIALISLIANKEAYAEQNDKFSKHYHAARILRDLEKINPDFYPKPIKRIKHEGGIDEFVGIDNGYLTKKEFVDIYEKCGGMMHAKNPFSGYRTVNEVRSIRACFPIWLQKIGILLSLHEIKLLGGKIMIVAMLKCENTGLPQAVIMGRVEE